MAYVRNFAANSIADRNCRYRLPSQGIFWQWRKWQCKGHVVCIRPLKIMYQITDSVFCIFCLKIMYQIIRFWFLAFWLRL